jgi:hypothetical protein
MSEETPAPQEVRLTDLKLDITSTDFEYEPAWIAHFQAQEAPQFAGVDPNLFVHPGAEDDGTRYA